MPTTDPLKRPALTRTAWLDAQEAAPGWWCLRIQRKQDEHASTTIATEWVETVDAGWRALDELDIALLSFGYIRSGEWEPGQWRGYVAWIEPYGSRQGWS